MFKIHQVRLGLATNSSSTSIESAQELTKLASMVETFGIPSRQVNCQYVMGSTSMYEFEAILRAAAERRMRITLLGYKTNGRGEQFKPQDYSKWGETLKKVNEETGFGLKIGIDTALAAESQSQLADLGVPKWCYEVQEGKFSMYIDAVAKKSSYGASLAMRPLKNKPYHLQEEITQHFARY